MAGEQAELERQYVLLGLKLPARGYYKDIAELREAVDVEKAARAEMSALDAERIALGVEVPPGGFPNATLYKAAIVAKRGAQQQPVGTSFVSGLDTPPTPKCPDGSRFEAMLGTCIKDTGERVGEPKCPDGYIKSGATSGQFQFGQFYEIGTCNVDAAAAAEEAAKLQADTAAAGEKAQAAIDKYTLSFNAVQTQKNQIQKTAEVMNAAAGKYTGVSKDLHYSVNQFDTHLKDLQNKINITNRRTPAPSWWPWLDIFLNVMLVLVLLYAIYSLIRRTYYVHPPASQVGYH
jgi:hypothetical protein